MINFFHECVPPTATAQQRRHNRNGQSYLPPSVKRAAAMLRAIFEQYAPAEPLTGPLQVTITWTWEGDDIGPTETGPDLDNLCKLALDAGTKTRYWLDDKQVCLLNLGKFKGPVSGIGFMCKQA